MTGPRRSGLTDHSDVVWPLSAVQEVADLQREAGAGVCPFCLNPLPRKWTARKPCICYRADCRTAYDTAYKRMQHGKYEPPPPEDR